MALTTSAIHLDGVNEHVTFVDNAGWDPVGAKFTLGIWFRRDWDDHAPGTTYEGFHSHLISSESRWGLWFTPDDEIAFWSGAAAALQIWYTGIHCSRDARHLIVISFETHIALAVPYVRLYLDGVLVATKAITTIMAAAATAVYLGVNYGTDTGLYFKGSITGFFSANNTTIPAAEVLTIWNDGVYDSIIGVAMTTATHRVAFTEYTGVAYAATVGAPAGVGVNTPEWNRFLDPCWTSTNKGGRIWEFGGANTMVSGSP